MKKLTPYIPSIFFGILVTVLSLLPGSNNNNKPFFYFEGIDKLIHLGMYLIFTFLLIYDHRKNNILKIKPILIISISILGFSILLEIIQYLYIPLRSGDLIDVAANLTGIILANIIHHILPIKTQKHKLID